MYDIKRKSNHYQILSSPVKKKYMTKITKKNLTITITKQQNR